MRTRWLHQKGRARAFLFCKEKIAGLAHLRLSSFSSAFCYTREKASFPFLVISNKLLNTHI